MELFPKLIASINPTGLHEHFHTGSSNDYSHTSYHDDCIFLLFVVDFHILIVLSSPAVAIISLKHPTLLHQATSRTQSL